MGMSVLLSEPDVRAVAGALAVEQEVAAQPPAQRRVQGAAAARRPRPRSWEAARCRCRRRPPVRVVASAVITGDSVGGAIAPGADGRGEASAANRCTGGHSVNGVVASSESGSAHVHDSTSAGDVGDSERGGRRRCRGRRRRRGRRRWPPSGAADAAGERWCRAGASPAPTWARQRRRAAAGVDASGGPTTARARARRSLGRRWTARARPAPGRAAAAAGRAGRPSAATRRRASAGRPAPRADGSSATGAGRSPVRGLANAAAGAGPASGRTAGVGGSVSPPTSATAPAGSARPGAGDARRSA